MLNCPQRDLMKNLYHQW